MGTLLCIIQEEFILSNFERLGKFQRQGCSNVKLQGLILNLFISELSGIW